MTISYNIIKTIIDLIRDSNPDKSTIIDKMIEFGFTDQRAQYWLSTFQHVINLYQNKDNTMENAKQWVRSQSVDSDSLTDMLIGMLSAFWMNEENVTIYKNDQVYKVITSRVANIRKMENERAHIMQQIKDLEAPDNNELIEWGKSVHPYYIQMNDLNSMLIAIDNEINKLKQLL